MVTNLESLLSPSKKERREVAEQLWLSVADEQRMPVPADHKKVINRRLQNYKKPEKVFRLHTQK